MLINLPIHNLKILAKRPVLDQLGPVKTKTGLKTEKDRGLRSFSVRSSLFQFWDEGRLVSVSVHALRAKKPDQTRLSSTRNYGDHDGVHLRVSRYSDTVTFGGLGKIYEVILIPDESTN